MARYIDAGKLLENLKNQYGEELGWQCTVNMSDVGMMIEDAPTADVVEVKHGEWIYNTDNFTPKMRCSVCGYNKPIAAGENIEQQPSDYCNKCGAKMDGERK